MTKHDRYWWRVEGKVVYGYWTGLYESKYVLMRTKDGKMWRVAQDEIRSEKTGEVYYERKRVT